MSWCQNCSSAPPALRGIHFPADFDDRRGSTDGSVWVARCDECYDPASGQGYASDAAAADAVSRLTGWSWHKSFDHVDALDPAARSAASPHAYRPYFAVLLRDAYAIMKPSAASRAPGRGRVTVTMAQCECGAFKTHGCGVGHPGHADYCPWRPRD